MLRLSAASNNFGNRITLFFSIYEPLDIDNKKSFSIQLLLSLLSACTEFIALGLSIPFINIFSGQLQDDSTTWVKSFNNIIDYFASKIASMSFVDLEIQSLSMILIALAFVSANSCNALFKSYVLKRNLKVSARIGNFYCGKICKGYLHTEYETLTAAEKSNKLTLRLTTQLNDLCAYVTYAFQVFSSAISLTSLLIVLILQPSGILSVATLLFIIIVYVIIDNRYKKILKLNSAKALILSESVLDMSRSIVDSIREINLGNNKSYFTNQILQIDKDLRKVTSSSQYLVLSPRYLIESFVYIAIGLSVLYLAFDSTKAINAVSYIGLVLLALQKIIPILQQFYAAFSSMERIKASINDLLSTLRYNSKTPSIIDSYNTTISNKHNQDQLPIKTLQLRDVSYKYPENKHATIQDVCLTLEQGDRLGIIGKSGSGKSTLVEIIAGLRTPTTGYLDVNEQDIYSSTELKNCYKKSVALIPQRAALIKDTVANNVAFYGLDNAIEFDSIRLSANKSLINEFIESLPERYSTNIINSCSQFSLGQLQRIAIARAMYKNANILILDEGTSSLDAQTQNSIMANIYNQGFDILIIIAHRTETLSDCNKVIEVSNGTVKFVKNKGQ